MPDFDGNIEPAAEWADIPRLSTTAIALGGEFGAMNAQAVAIAKRLNFLDEEKASLDAMAASTGGALVKTKQAGAGAVDRSIESKLRDGASVKDNGAIGDAVTNDSAAISSTLTDYSFTDAPPASYILSGVVIPTASRGLLLRGDFYSPSDNVAVLSYTADTSRTHVKTLSGGGSVQGNGHTGVTGVKIGSLTNNPSPGAHEAVLYMSIRDLKISGCDTGLYSVVSMEHSYDNVILKSCVVGMELYSDVFNGGGNANAYRAMRAQSCTVGIIVRSFAAFPLHNNAFDSLLLQENSTCGFYAKGYSVAGAVAGLAIRNVHVESNGLGAATVVRDGDTIKRSDFHLVQTTATISDSDIASSLSPMLIAETYSVVHAENLTGYGNPNGKVYDPDDTSAVYESGLAITVGIKKIESYGFLPRVGSMAVIGSPKMAIGTQYRNDSAMDNPAIPTLDNTTGAVAVSNEYKAQLGIVSSLQFAASVGNTGTNRNYWYGGAGTAGEYCLMSFIVMSNADTVIRAIAEFDAAHKSFDISLKANTPRRIIITGQQPGTTGMQLYLYPLDSVGAVLSFKAFQYLHTTDVSVISRAYNEGHCGVKKPEYESCTPLPTTSGTPNGYIVWKPVAAAGASPGDINTATSGAPVWKALPAVAA